MSKFLKKYTVYCISVIVCHFDEWTARVEEKSHELQEISHFAPLRSK